MFIFFLQITSSTVVCSKHFKEDDYKGWNPVRKRLNPNAVPSVFDWKLEKSPRRVLKRKYQDQSSDRTDASPETDVLQSEVDFEDIQEPTITIDKSVWHEKQTKLKELEDKLQQKSREVEHLEQQLRIEKFGVARFSHDDSLISFYSGFQTYKTFVSFF